MPSSPVSDGEHAASSSSPRWRISRRATPSSRTATCGRARTWRTTASARAREIERRVGEEREAVLLDWLEALDSVERALRMTPDAEGLQAVLEQMEAILARQGVARAGAPGEPFDPGAP